MNKILLSLLLLMPLSGYAITCPSIEEIQANLKSHHKEDINHLDDFVYDFVDSQGNSWDGPVVHEHSAKPSDIGLPTIFNSVMIPTKKSPGVSVTCYYKNTRDGDAIPLPGVHTKLELQKLNDRSEIPPYFKGIDSAEWGQYQRICKTGVNECRFSTDE